MPERPRLTYIVTIPTTARLLLKGQLRRMCEWGFDVSVISSPSKELDLVRDREGVQTYGVPIERDVSPTRDPETLSQLIRLLRQLRPHIVNASTPKAGLLGTLAARVARVPIRIYLLRGLRLETAEGRLARVLGLTERLASASAHEVVCVSRSLLERYVSDGYAPWWKTKVLGAGSSNGVDVDFFRRTPETGEAGRLLRRDLGIPDAARVIGFAGRPVEDKGIRWLLDAFDQVRVTRPDLRLLMVGADLAGDDVDPVVRERIAGRPEIHMRPFVDDMRAFYAAIQVLAFPSLREGFPNVPLEASAASLPVVGCHTTGVVDAVADGLTGRIVPARDGARMAGALAAYLDDADLAARHGEAGRARADAQFDSRRVWRAWFEEYVRLLGERGLPLPEAAGSA